MRLFYLAIITLFIVSSCQRFSHDEIMQVDDLEDSAKVLDYLNDIIDTDQNNAQVYYKRAQVYLKMGDYRRAGIDVQKAVDLKSTDPDYYLLKSLIFDRKNNASESIAAALQAEQRALRNYELYRLMAVNYLKLNEAESAKESIQRLLDFNRNGENLSLQGDILLQLNDTTSAIKSYEAAIEQQNNLIRPYRSLYTIYASRNTFKKAEQYIDDYLILESQNEEFLIMKAQLLMGRASYDSTLTYLKLGNTQRSTDLEELNMLGKTYYALGKYDSALIISEKCWNIDSFFVENNFLKARTLDKLGNYEDAIDVYSYLLKSDSTLVIASQELENLNRKVAYLWRLKQQEKAFDNIRNSPPPAVGRKEVNN